MCFFFNLLAISMGNCQLRNGTSFISAEETHIVVMIGFNEIRTVSYKYNLNILLLSAAKLLRTLQKALACIGYWNNSGSSIARHKTPSLV